MGHRLGHKKLHIYNIFAVGTKQLWSEPHIEPNQPVNHTDNDGQCRANS